MYNKDNKESVQIRNRRNYLKRKSIIIDRAKQRYLIYKDEILSTNKTNSEYKIYQKQYKQSHRTEFNKYIRDRLKSNINFKLITNIRSRIRLFLHGKNRSEHTKDLLGCTQQELKLYLNQNFNRE